MYQVQAIKRQEIRQLQVQSFLSGQEIEFDMHFPSGQVNFSFHLPTVKNIYLLEGNTMSYPSMVLTGASSRSLAVYSFENVSVCKLPLTKLIQIPFRLTHNTTEANFTCPAGHKTYFFYLPKVKIYLARVIRVQFFSCPACASSRSLYLLPIIITLFQCQCIQLNSWLIGNIISYMQESSRVMLMVAERNPWPFTLSDSPASCTHWCVFLCCKLFMSHFHNYKYLLQLNTLNNPSSPLNVHVHICLTGLHFS